MREREEAWRVLVEEALAAAHLLEHGPVVDVGSGGGSPGIPLAVARPDLRFDLLESQRRKSDFLAAAAREFPNVGVVRGRAEELARGAGRDAYGAALARALAPPPVAAEWCLPLVREGGMAVLYVGSTVDEERVARVAGLLNAEPAPSPAGLVVLRKAGPTPERFPRRPGVARKRPLA